MTAIATRQTALAKLTNKLAAQFDMGENGQELMDTLKQTAFKGQVSDAQMTALMIVANQYGLNPWTKEIYAFPDRQNGIVPVVGVDGWARIINDHPKFDGMEFQQDAESCTCVIYRKDRSRPIAVTEYRNECQRNTAPWQTHPRRMLRHKAMIQAARLAFGYGGIFDQDEAERITEKHMGQAEIIPNGQPASGPAASRTDDIKAKLAARKAATSQPAPVMADGEAMKALPDLPMVLTLIRDAGTPEELHGASEMAKRLTSEADKTEARKHFKARQASMKRDADAAAKAQADAEAEARRREAEEEARLEREAIQAESDGETTAADFFAGEAA